MTVLFLLAAIAYYLLQGLITANEGGNSLLSRTIGGNLKGKISLLLYAAAVPLAFLLVWIADAIYVALALLWLVPDARIERAIETRSK